MAPHFVMRPKDGAALEGSTVLLYCAANGRDRQGQLPTISWLKDGITVDMEWVWIVFVMFLCWIDGIWSDFNSINLE